MSNSNNLFPWQMIPDSNVFDTGIYEFEVKECDHTNRTKEDKMMPKARFECVAPEKFKGLAYFENYVVGTDELPNEVVHSTMGARQLKQMFVAAQVPRSENLEELAVGSVGNRLLIHLNKYTEASGEYKGQERNRVIGYYKLGEREVGVTEDKQKATGPKTPAPPTTGGGAPSTSPPPSPATTKCTVCGKDIPREEFSSHIETCEG